MAAGYVASFHLDMHLCAVSHTSPFGGEAECYRALKCRGRLLALGTSAQIHRHARIGNHN